MDTCHGRAICGRVVTGTILSFEMGLLWPNFTATFGGVFGLGFAIEGFSFFMEAIFLGIYVYGWGRLSPRAHFISGIPIAIAGITGSLTVISVSGGRAVGVHPLAALFGNRYLWRINFSPQSLALARVRTLPPRGGHHPLEGHSGDTSS